MLIFSSFTTSRMSKKRSATCFVPALKAWFPMTLSVAVSSMCNGALLNSDPNPSSVIMLVQNITSFIASAAAMSSAFVINMAVRL